MAKMSRAEKFEEAVIDRTSPPGELIYEAIYAEGEHELHRNTLMLALSGLTAGLSMGFSMVGEALLRHHLPAASWSPLIAKFGYSIGFLVVILGRQQLFTKNTLTVVLPLLRHKNLATIGLVGRLWAIVLSANLVGAFFFALFVAQSSAFTPEVRQVFGEIGRAAAEPAFGTLLVRGVVAGWLIALMIWLIPFADAGRIWVIVILAYFVGLAELPHIIAGSVEVFYLVATGAMSFGTALGHYIVPTLIGNVIGGVALVAVGAHAEHFEAEKVSD